MDEIVVGFLTVIKPEIEALREVLEVAGTVEMLPPDHGTIYLEAHLQNEFYNRLRVIVACIGSAGNNRSSAAASALIGAHHPSLIVLSGIAAGLRGKTKIGEVVSSERVVAYEGAAIVGRRAAPALVEPRPDMASLDKVISQSLVYYKLDASRVMKFFHDSGGSVPQISDLRNTKPEEICLSPSHRSQTFASGEKLLRDGKVLARLRRRMHGRIEVGEMEAAGVATACAEVSPSIPWLIFRGISDFGDRRKSDNFHDYAARMAAAVAVDFLQHGFNPQRGERPSWAVGAKTDDLIGHLPCDSSPTQANVLATTGCPASTATEAAGPAHDERSSLPGKALFAIDVPGGVTTLGSILNDAKVDELASAVSADGQFWATLKGGSLQVWALHAPSGQTHEWVRYELPGDLAVAQLVAVGHLARGRIEVVLSDAMSSWIVSVARNDLRIGERLEGASSRAVQVRSAWWRLVGSTVVDAGGEELVGQILDLDGAGPWGREVLAVLDGVDRQVRVGLATTQLVACDVGDIDPVGVTVPRPMRGLPGQILVIKHDLETVPVALPRTVLEGS